MARATYVPEQFGDEIVAPSGYYQPVGEELLDYKGRQLLCVQGRACIEASCCGVGSWAYVRVEGYVVDRSSSQSQGSGGHTEIDTVEDDGDKAAISRLLHEKHPGARIEFR